MPHNRSMGRALLLRAFILFVFAVIARPTWAGQSSHGSDNKNGTDGAVWFLDANRTVKYCIDLGQDFGIDRITAESEIQSVFQDWKQYIETKLPVRDINRNFSRRGFATNFVLEPCSGTQNLTFFLGTTTDSVRQELARYDDPAAFAHRISYDEEAGWSSGYVWVSNPRSFTFEVGFPLRPKIVLLDWRESYTFRAILMHEVGHVFGIEHVGGTIMDEQILRRILAPKLYPDSCTIGSSFTYRIDNEKDLVPCIACASDRRSETWVGRVPDTALRILIGREPIGLASALLNLKYDGLLELVVSDALGSALFTLTPKQSSAQRKGIDPIAPKIFRIYFKDQDGRHEAFFQPKLQEEMELQMVYDENMIDVLFVRNGLDNRSPVLLTWNGLKVPLFEAASSYSTDGCYIPREIQKPFWLMYRPIESILRTMKSSDVFPDKG